MGNNFPKWSAEKGSILPAKRDVSTLAAIKRVKLIGLKKMQVGEILRRDKSNKETMWT